MTRCIRIHAVATEEMRLVSRECHDGCDEAAVAMFKAALSFVHAQPGGPGRVIETPPLAIAPPKKPRRRHP